MNEFEVILVQNDLHQKGIFDYKLLPGNNSIWASYGLVNCYYVFCDGKIVDIQFD